MPVITILQLNPLQYWFLFLTIGKKIGKKKGNELIKQWVQSIKNHIYWCAASSNGNKTVMREKWMSLFNHIVDIDDLNMSESIVNLFSFPA